jgi:hypothetical protein
MTLRAELEAYASDGREAFVFLDGLFDGVIARLRRDYRFSHIRRQELESLLADIRADAEQQLFHLLVDRVRLDDID